MRSKLQSRAEVEHPRTAQDHARCRLSRSLKVVSDHGCHCVLRRGPWHRASSS
jgi:hypothetical protein